VHRRTALMPVAALLGAGIAVTAGVAAGQPDDSSTRFSAQLAAATANANAGAGHAEAQLDASRRVRISRSDQRPAVDRTKAHRLTAETKSGGQATRTKDLTPAPKPARQHPANRPSSSQPSTSQDPRTVARMLLPQFGFGSDQFSCLDALWNRESGWDVHAANPTSSAYGIPQALPGSKMASAGADWATNPTTQIRWGLGYIAASYGSPCGAWAHSESYGWY
jgi:hypothetical protein